jgi:hypothetical protein
VSRSLGKSTRSLDDRNAKRPCDAEVLPACRYWAHATIASVACATANTAITGTDAFTAALSRATLLDPDDLARVEADPAMQSRWVETWQAAAPLLADVERMINTVGHLREPVTMSQAVRIILPYNFEHNWADVFLDSTGTLATYVGRWVWDWCSVRRRWDEGRFEMLQPRHPAVWQLFYKWSRARCGAPAARKSWSCKAHQRGRQPAAGGAFLRPRGAQASEATKGRPEACCGDTIVESRGGRRIDRADRVYYRLGQQQSRICWGPGGGEVKPPPRAGGRWPVAKGRRPKPSLSLRGVDQHYCRALAKVQLLKDQPVRRPARWPPPSGPGRPPPRPPVHFFGE